MYRYGSAVLRILIRLVFGLQVTGLDNVPTQGGAVIAINHTSWFDPLAVGVSFRRPIHFMAKAELFENRFVRWLLRTIYAFPVRRGLADREAIRTAQDVVVQGGLLGIFPEGTRSSGEAEILPLQGGAALIALKTGAPVLPVVVAGVRPFRFRQAVKVAIGKPIELGGPKKANKQTVKEASEVISSQFRALLSRNN